MRGKESLAAARKRIREVEELAENLRSELLAERTQAAVIQESLRREIQALKRDIARDAKIMADSLLKESKQDAVQAVMEVRQKHESQVIAGLFALEEAMPDGIQMVYEDFINVSEAFGIHVGAWLGARPGVSRETRRTTNKTGRDKGRLLNEIRATPEGRSWLANSTGYGVGAGEDK